MSAGTGVRHSEFSPSPNVPAHLLQIWILPDELGTPPSYEQKSFGDEQRNKQLVLIGSTDGRDGSITVHQDVSIYAGTISGSAERTHMVRPGRRAWVHVAEGSVTVKRPRTFSGRRRRTRKRKRSPPKPRNQRQCVAV
jgi:redox-sensitive bicupin YhaK (pirin superfamily)